MYASSIQQEEKSFVKSGGIPHFFLYSKKRFKGVILGFLL